MSKATWTKKIKLKYYTFSCTKVRGEDSKLIGRNKRFALYNRAIRHVYKNFAGSHLFLPVVRGMWIHYKLKRGPGPAPLLNTKSSPSMSARKPYKSAHWADVFDLFIFPAHYNDRHKQK